MGSEKFKQIQESESICSIAIQTTAITTSTTATTAAFGLDGAEVAAASSPDEIAISLPPDDHLSTAIDEISGSIADQVFEFCETDLFRETLQNSEVTSSSHCYYDENSSYTANITFPSEVGEIEKYTTQQFIPNKYQNDPNENFNASTTTSCITTTTVNNNNNNNFSITFDSPDEFENDISASIDFSTSPPFSGAPYLTISHQDQLDFASVDNSSISVSHYPDSVIPFMGPPPPSLYEENCLSMMPPFLRLNPSVSSSATASSYSFFDPSMGSSFLPGSLNASLGVQNSGIFNGNMLEMQPKDELQRVYNSSDTQSISNDNQQLVNGTVSTPLSTEISNLDDSSFKPGKLSAEQRKEKIQRYMKKRNERNFSKKIKYACRKTLADSRPRVRGRFARNDDSGDAHRHINDHQEEDGFDEVRACVSSLLHYRNF